MRTGMEILLLLLLLLGVFNKYMLDIASASRKALQLVVD
jgi:hypothetical protein